MTWKRLAIYAAIGLAVFLAIDLGLHFGQIRHDRLDYDIEREFPAGRSFPPGAVFGSTLAALVDHELHDAFGWRPNDFFPWGPRVMADNNSNRQLGIIMAVRETTRVFKDHLTKVSSDQYDANLIAADTNFRNDAERWILPTPESRYDLSINHLHKYVAGLRASPKTSRELNVRAVELVRLFQAWTDLLGDAHANLYRTRRDDGSPVRAWNVDDYFYHAQGYAHVMHHMMRALKVEYAQVLKDDPVLTPLFDETIDALGKAASLKPVMVMDGSPGGVVANHRRNLDTYITEARQKMYSIREELRRSPMA
jgi:hypothetical protein